MAAIEIKNLHKRFGQTEVLRGIDLAIADAEFVVFVGPSGCGKSTLLRTIAGLDDCTGGSIHIGGRDATHLPASQRQVAMVFQSYALYPHMTVLDNLSFGMRMRGVAAATISTKLQGAIDMLQLEPYLSRKPGELSGGQNQRVAIGRAIVQEPGVFLFDEPLSNLDAELRLHMRLEIARLHRELNTTMVYVTHDQVEAMTLAQRIVVLRSGAIEQVGSPMALYSNPANTFVAGFIGSPAMNLLPATLAGQLATLKDGSQLTVELAAAELAAAAAQSNTCTVGVRPEHLLPAPDGPLALQLQAIERLGASTLLHGTVAGSAFTAEHRGACPWRQGELLRLAVQPGQLHVFSALGHNIGLPKVLETVA
jgi:ABC-type sugar transport system ATPase subunit